MIGTQAQEPNLANLARLRFSCPACRLKLAVPSDLAGVRAPCPGCGCEITAPMKPAPQPIRVLPRQPRRQGADADSAGLEVVPVLKESAEPKPQRRRRQLRFQAGRNFAAIPVAPDREADSRERLRRSGSIYAGTGISARYQERKDMVSLAKISVAVLLVLVAALVVAFVTKNEVDPVDRGPVPEVPKLDPTRI